MLLSQNFNFKSFKSSQELKREVWVLYGWGIRITCAVNMLYAGQKQITEPEGFCTRLCIAELYAEEQGSTDDQFSKCPVLPSL